MYKLGAGVLMYNRNKGQATIETLIALSVILILLVLVLWEFSYRSYLNSSVEEVYDNVAVCNRISSLINLISHNSEGNEIIIGLDRNVTIANRIISVGGDYCLFYANAAAADLVQGNVRIYDYNGVVYLENI